MSLDNQQYKTIKQGYFLISISIAFVLFGSMLLLNLFCPDFIFKINAHGKISLVQYLQDNFFATVNKGKIAAASCYLIFQIIIALLNVLFFGNILRTFMYFVTYKPWLKKYINEHTKIINSCDSSTFNDRVAILVSTCNDCVPSTILQTAKQTYKNVDVWICDDSSNPDHMQMIDEFAKQHNIRVFRRSQEHRSKYRSKVGNVFAWVDAHGNDYDYILENDSSSLVTETFVENCLRYFHSPLLKDYKIGGIIGHGTFYNFKTNLSWVNNYMTHFNEANFFGSSTRSVGNPIYLQGWGCFYKIETLKTIPLEEIICPQDDVSRGSYLSAHGYTNFLNPFDFTGKLGIRNMDGWRSQRLKWAASEVHLFRNKIYWGQFKNKGFNAQMHTFLIGWGTCVFMPIIMLLTIANTILLLAVPTLNFINLSQYIFIGTEWAILVIVLLILGFKNRSSLKNCICFALTGLIEISLIFKRLFQVIFVGWIAKKWTASAVTNKKDVNTSIKDKFKVVRFDIVILLIIIGIWVGLSFVGPIDKINLWTAAFFFFAGPSIVYILMVFVGEIKVSSGWDASLEYYDGYYMNSERYNIVKDSEVWKQQHNKKGL